MKAMYRVARKAAPGLVGQVEFAVGRHARLPPMNGQAARIDLVRQLIARCSIGAVVETGTFRGATTEFLGSFGLPTVSFELDPLYLAFSRRRLRGLSNVSVRAGHSVSGLKRLFSEGWHKPIPTLFYLDAHWNDDLPLADELALIFENHSRAVIMVDDFRVADDAGYAFDDYGPGKTLDVDYVAKAGVAGLSLFFPTVRSDQETGARRGVVVIARDPDLVAQLRGIRLLREWLPTPTKAYA